METSIPCEQVLGEASPPALQELQQGRLPAGASSSAVLGCPSSTVVYFRENKPSGFLPPVAARLPRVLYSEDNSDEGEQSGGCRSSWHSLYSSASFLISTPTPTPHRSFFMYIVILHVHRECRACLGAGRPLSLSGNILSCSSWATISPSAFLPAFHAAYRSTHSCSSPSRLYFFTASILVSMVSTQKRYRCVLSLSLSRL